MSVVLFVSAPVSSFTSGGVTVTQSGVTVPDNLVPGIISAAASEDVPIFMGGTAADLEPLGPAWFNPGTGAPSTGTWQPGQLVVDSTGALFIRTAGGSWVAPNGVGTVSSIDCGSSS